MIKFPLHKQIYGSLLVVIVLCAPLAFSGDPFLILVFILDGLGPT